MQAPPPSTRIRRPAAALLLALALAGCGGGGRDGTAPGMEPGMAAGPALGAADLGFLNQATYNDLAAIGLGRMAGDEAADPAVRGMAGRLVDEHRDSIQELHRLADGYGIDLPENLSAGRGAVEDRLSRLDGPDFDAQYLQQQIADYEVAQALYQNEADRGGAPQLRDFAQRWLPTIEHRADELRALSDRLAGLPTPLSPAPGSAPEPSPVQAAPLAPPENLQPENLQPQNLQPEELPPPDVQPGSQQPPDLPPPGGDAGAPPPETLPEQLSPEPMSPGQAPPAQPTPRIDIP